MNVMIEDIANEPEATFWLNLAKEKGVSATYIDAEDAWLANLISKGVQEQTLTGHEMYIILTGLEAVAQNEN